MKKWIKKIKKWKDEPVIYGITDRRNDPFIKKVNDFLIDNSPIGEKEKSMFFVSLHLLISSGVNIVRALEILAERQKNIRFRRTLNSIVYDIKKGMSFSSALSKFPKIFQKSEIGIIHAGELSGRIEENISNVAAQISKNIEIKIRVQSALIYPMVVLFTMILSLIIILIFVVPQFKELFAQFPEEELPFTTKTISALSNFFINFWWIILSIFVGIFFIIKNSLKTQSGKKKAEKIISSIPGIKRIIKFSQTIEITSNLAAFLDSGIPILNALGAIKDITKSVSISNAIIEAKHEIAGGKRIYQAFQKPIFDPVLSEVLEIGEQNGKMSEMLHHVARQYEIEVDAELKNLSVLLEPTMILLMGGAVIFIAFAVLTPVFELQSLISAQ